MLPLTKLVLQINTHAPETFFLLNHSLSSIKGQKAVPLRTMSTMVLNAFAESLSVGEMKFPAALFTTTDGSSHSDSTFKRKFVFKNVLDRMELEQPPIWRFLAYIRGVLVV